MFLVGPVLVLWKKNEEMIHWRIVFRPCVYENSAISDPLLHSIIS